MGPRRTHPHAGRGNGKDELTATRCRGSGGQRRGSGLATLGTGARGKAFGTDGQPHLRGPGRPGRNTLSRHRKRQLPHAAGSGGMHHGAGTSRCTSRRSKGSRDRATSPGRPGGQRPGFGTWSTGPGRLRPRTAAGHCPARARTRRRSGGRPAHGAQACSRACYGDATTGQPRTTRTSRPPHRPGAAPRRARCEGPSTATPTTTSTPARATSTTAEPTAPRTQAAGTPPTSGTPPQQLHPGQVVIHEPVHRQVLEHPHTRGRMRTVRRRPAQHHLQGPTRDLEQHPEQGGSGEHGAELVGLRNAQSCRAGSEEQLQSQDERHRLRDLNDQTTGHRPPPQPRHRIGQRMSVARKGQRRGHGQQRHDGDAHEEADQHREHQGDHHRRQKQQIQLQPGGPEQGEGQDLFHHALPGVRHVAGHHRMGQGVGQADRLAHHGQRGGCGDHPEEEPGEDLLEGVAGLDGLVPHDRDTARGHEQHINPGRDPQHGGPQLLDVGVLGDIGRGQQSISEQLANRLHDLLDQHAEERGNRVHDHAGNVEEVPEAALLRRAGEVVHLARRRSRPRRRFPRRGWSGCGGGRIRRGGRTWFGGGPRVRTRLRGGSGRTGGRLRLRGRRCQRHTARRQRGGGRSGQDDQSQEPHRRQQQKKRPAGARGASHCPPPPSAPTMPCSTVTITGARMASP